MDILLMLFLLLGAHALADFALQSDWLVEHKSRNSQPMAGISTSPKLIWLHVLTAHCLIHGLFVTLITGHVWLGIAETTAHWVIDFLKGENKFGFHTDQFLHIICKIMWLVILFVWLQPNAQPFPLF